jgi:DNA repair protein RecO (recombination protein O)
VLRTVRYGETSVIVLIFTEKFGIQSYLVNGVRTNSKKGGSKSGYFQPAAILDLVVYHNELKQLNRIREFKWDHLYTRIFSDVIKNAVALFMVELLTKSLKQPEANEELFNFVEDAFVHLDKASDPVTANFPLFFALQLAVFLGFRIQGNLGSAGSSQVFLDLKEGVFATQTPPHSDYLEGKPAMVTAELLRVMQPSELEEIKLNREMRRELLHAFEKYYALQIQDFGKMRTLPVIEEILS